MLERDVEQRVLAKLQRREETFEFRYLIEMQNGRWIQEVPQMCPQGNQKLVQRVVPHIGGRQVQMEQET